MRDVITIEELEQFLTNTTYLDYVSDIERLSKDSDWFVRAEIARLLSSYHNGHAEKILLALLHDKSYLVQVEAIDSLGSFYSNQIRKRVLACMNSAHPLVRGYAYRWMCATCPDELLEGTIELLQGVREKNTWARIMLHISLLQLGDSDSLHILKRTYGRCNYLNRIAILNGLTDSFSLLSRQEQEEITSFVNDLSLIDGDIAVCEAIERLKEEIMNTRER